MAIHLPKPNQSPEPPQRTAAANANNGSYDNMNLSHHYTAYNDSKFYAWEGRIGRIQYMAYPTFFAFFAVLVILLLLAVTGGMQSLMTGNTQSMTGVMVIVIGVLWLLLAYIQFATTKRRLNDLNKTGWLSLLLFIPLVSLILYVYLMFVKGDAGSNRYGLPPSPPSKLVIIVGLVLPLVGVAMIGVIAAIAIPAYQDYVTRAQTAQTQAINTAASTPEPDMTAAANTAASASQSVPLRQETVVISGEQLGNGAVPTNQSQPSSETPLQTAPPVAAEEAADSQKPLNNSDLETLMPDTPPPNNKEKSGNDKPTPQGSMSYEDFIKTSQTTVYIDR